MRYAPEVLPAHSLRSLLDQALACARSCCREELCCRRCTWLCFDSIARQVSWWLLYPEKAQSQAYRREGVQPTRQAKALIETFQEVSHPVRAVTSRARELIEMMANRPADCLDRWLEEATHENVPELTHFVKSLRQDYSAVHGALHFEWSNGQVEGQVNRLKMIKRQMYGRAGFVLLRKRVLAA